MKILSLNICIKIDNAQAVADYLLMQNADIICLQEVVRPLEEGVIPIFRAEEVIRRNLKSKYPYYFFAPEWVSDIHYEPKGMPDRIFGGMAEQGKLIMSKYPIIHGYNYFYVKDYEFDRDRRSFFEGNDHGRALQICEIDVNGQMIQIANIHGTYVKNRQDTDLTIMQSKFILEKMKKNNLPTIILGDFNVVPDTQSIAILNNEYQNLNNAFNIQSTRPIHKGNVNLDYVFIDSSFKCTSLIVDEVDISDHYPLIAEIENV